MSEQNNRPAPGQEVRILGEVRIALMQVEGQPHPGVQVNYPKHDLLLAQTLLEDAKRLVDAKVRQAIKMQIGEEVPLSEEAPSQIITGRFPSRAD